MDTTQILPHPTSPKDELWAHQRIAVERARDLNYYALFFEPGTGKTATSIHIARHKFTVHKSVLPTLILCPPVVIPNWKNEWAKFSKVDPKKVVPLVGTGKQRLELLKTSPIDSIFITNYETLLMKDVYAYLKSLFSTSPLPPLLIADEAHKAKDPGAKRTKLLMELAPLFKYRYILTGTPILNSLMDVYSQFKILDLGQRFGKNFYSFRAIYFEDKNKTMPAQKYFPDWRPQKGADERIRKQIQDCSMFAAKSECLDLPPLVKKIIEVPMGSEQKRLYESMKRDLIATVMGEDGKLRASIAELAITKALRLQQIVSGHLRVESEGQPTATLKIKDNPRRDALRDLLEDLAPAHKVLVWAVFKDNYEDIRAVCDSLKLQYVELHGEIKDKEGQAHCFRNDPKVRVLIGHPGSGGIGLNLVEASYMIYYSRAFSLEFDIQSEARAYRGGSERHESITRIDLVAPSTIDELVLKSLEAKQQLGDAVLKAHLNEI
jgi:SNF2 family DNA or RNA helicase